MTSIPPAVPVSTVDFPLGGFQQGQTEATIQRMLHEDDADLAVAGYGYYDATTLDHLGLGDWLAARPGRRLVLLLGVQGSHPLPVAPAPWTKALGQFQQLLRIWRRKGVPLAGLHIYAIEHWHLKLAATLRSLSSRSPGNFDSEDPRTPADFESAFSYDRGVFDFDADGMIVSEPRAVIAGDVVEAVVGSSNATFTAMTRKLNFEFDVHIKRTSALELGEFSAKLASILQHAMQLANHPGTVSYEATRALRGAMGPRATAAPVPPPSPVPHGGGSPRR